MGASSDSGPMAMALVAAPESWTAPSTVNVSVVGAFRVTTPSASRTDHLPATNWSVISPLMKVSLTATPAFGDRK